MVVKEEEGCGGTCGRTYLGWSRNLITGVSMKDCYTLSHYVRRFGYQIIHCSMIPIQPDGKMRAVGCRTVSR